MRTKRISRLWERMTALYGSRWVLEYGNAQRADGELEVVADLWADALDGLNNDQLGAGLRACIDRDSGHPPSLPEFLRLCGYQPASRVPYHRAAALTHERHEKPDAAICQKKADELRALAEVELEPRLTGLLPDDRSRAVAAYWLTKIAAIPGLGSVVAKQLKETA